MIIKQEIFRMSVLVFTSGFFLLAYISTKTEKLIFFLYGVISLIIAIVIAVYGTNKGLEPEGVKKRLKWIEQGMPIFFIPFVYGAAVLCFILGVINYITTRQTGPIIGLTILAIIVAAIARYVQRSFK